MGTLSLSISVALLVSSSAKPGDPKDSPSSPNGVLPHPVTDEQGTAFLAKKAKEAGVVSLKTGLMYKPLKHGDGKHHPSPYSPVTMHHKASLINGTVIGDSLREDGGEPFETQPFKLVQGWSWLLQDMVVGDRWELYLPAEFAYGVDGDAHIPPRSALVIDCELTHVGGQSMQSRRKRPHEEEM